MQVINDTITTRQYIQLEAADNSTALLKNISLGFNKDNFLLANVKIPTLDINETRFLNSQGELFVTESTPEEIYATAFPNPGFTTNNKLTFYLGTGHGIIHLECNSCDEGNYHSYFYDGTARIEERHSFYLTFDYAQIDFFLTDSKSNDVFSSLSDMLQEEQNGTYKYVPLIHNCVAPMTYIFSKSKFENHYSLFFKDEELLARTEIVVSDPMFSAFIHRAYFPSDYINPNRPTISAFMETKYGEDYREKWGVIYDYDNGGSRKDLRAEIVDENDLIDNP